MSETLDIQRAKEIIAARGECAGPMCGLPPSNGFSRETVTIICGGSYVPVVEWLAACDKQFPAAVERVEQLEAALEKAVRWIADHSDEENYPPILYQLHGVLRNT